MLFEGVGEIIDIFKSAQQGDVRNGARAGGEKLPCKLNAQIGDLLDRWTAVEVNELFFEVGVAKPGKGGEFVVIEAGRGVILGQVVDGGRKEIVLGRGNVRRFFGLDVRDDFVEERHGAGVVTGGLGRPDGSNLQKAIFKLRV